MSIAILAQVIVAQGPLLRVMPKKDEDPIVGHPAFARVNTKAQCMFAVASWRQSLDEEHADLLDQLYDLPPNFRTKIEYDEEIDLFLYETVGYDALNQICTGIFISAYAATSINEYFARGFEEYFLNNPETLKQMCPRLYEVIRGLADMEG